MAEKSIIEIIKRYFSVLNEEGIHPCRGILFGSYARNDANEWSDIDIIIVAPEFDYNKSEEIINTLWRSTIAADNRIEPIPCGEKEWINNESRPILEIARNEGIEISA